MVNKKIIALAALTVLFCCICYAKNKPADKEYEIDINDFNDSRHHWYDIYEANNVINPEPNQPCYKPTQIEKIADNILLYQRDNGGWPKNYDIRAILTKEQKNKVFKAKSLSHTTFDNHTTYTQIEYLAKAYEITKVKKYKDAALRGIDFTLSAQYPNGGWPQFFPLEKNYSRHITFNDDAMTGVMKMLKDIIDNNPYYSFVDSAHRQKIKAAFEKGLDCILKCQIIDNGKLTVWCQQHDENDLRPALGRAYELPSICDDESANVVLLLMSMDKPSKEIINSAQAAVKWFEESKIFGIRVEEFNAPPVKYPLRVSKIDRKVVEDKSAPPIWARFYELGTHKPLFADRRGVSLYSLAEVDRERRSGYTYYTYEPQKVLDAHPAWQAKWAPGQNTPIASAVDVSRATTDASAAGRPRHQHRNQWADFSKQPDNWYRSKEGIRIANNILSWQSLQGSWPKNISTTREPFTSDPNTIRGTFDNSATTEEIRFLARAFRATKDKRYKQAVLKGIDHILKAQYPTGGWPQFYPLDKDYSRHITFNDNTMVRLMNFLRDVAASRDFAFLDSGRRKAAQKSFDRGIQCILKCQIMVNGKPTVWCAQHDELDYSPRPARTYELVSLSGSESTGILELLMSLDHPSAEVVRAIEAGKEWYESSKITGIRIVWTGSDRVVEKDPNAPPLWARFYEIESNRPIFSGRDGVKKYSLAEIEQERRKGYAWYGSWGQRVAEDYAKWKEKLAPRQNILKK